jgi:two-component system response regulator (stage 0 sporulation protein A)
MNTGDILLTIGVPASIKGYKFLIFAVEESRKRPELLDSITKALYPAVAERYITTASKAERAMRHAIDVAASKGGFPKLNGILGIDIFTKNDKPTNGEFIALLAMKAG